MEEDPDYDNVTELDTDGAASLVRELKKDFKGSGAVWMPWRTDRIQSKEARSKLAFDLKLALEAIGFDISHINITKSGIIIYLKDPAKKVPELAELGQVKVNGTGEGKVRPVWIFTKECLTDSTVMISDTIEQSEGKLIPVQVIRMADAAGTTGHPRRRQGSIHPDQD